MKFQGTIIGAASGSLRTDVFSHNRGGQYIRNRTIPVQPNTAEQLSVQQVIFDLNKLWLAKSTADRELWEVYAANVPVINRIGRPGNIGGRNMFIRLNHTRKEVKFGVVPFVTADPPSTFDEGALGVITNLLINAAAGQAQWDVNVGDPWYNQTGGFLAAWSSPSKPLTVNFYKGPYRRGTGFIAGDDVAPPPNPQLMFMPFFPVVGERVFFQFKASDAEGRVSYRLRRSTIAIA